MPRASIPSPRLLACADPPFLPFLAPRAFAETPVSKNKPHEGTRKRYQKEKGYGRNDKLESVLNSPRCDATVQERSWRIRTKPPTTKSHAGRTLSNAFQSSGVFRYDDYLSRKNPNRHSLDQRYADIFSFAPQQTRNYNTKHLAAKSEERWPSNVARANQPRNREGIARKAALATEQMRMDNFLSYEPGLLESDFLKKGRYRSLRRRILNLQQRTVSTVKMGEYNDNDRSSLHDGLMLAFAALDQEAYPRLRRITSPIRIQHDPRCVEWASRLWMDVEEDKHNAETVQLNWKKFSEKETKECWHHLLIYFLHLMPARAIILIEILGHETDVWALHPHILADSLNCLAMTLTKERRHASDQILTSGLRTLRKTFVPFFYHNFRRHLIQHSQVCPQDLFCSVVDMADMEELKTVFDLLVEARTYLGYDTLLHYANAFARGGENELALRCLTEIKKRNNAVGWQAVVNRDRFRWTCALILRQSTKKGHNYHGVPGILATFVELGVKLDILLYNVVMNNAMDVGDHVTAFKVYNALEKNGMRPGRDTFSIMLHGCTRQSTPAMFHDFAEYCAEMAIEMKSPRLAAGYLHYFYICHQDDSNLQRTSTELLHVYARFFNLDLLEPFLGKTREELKRLIDENQSSSISEPLMPPPLAVYIILQTAIRNAFEESNERVWGLYQLFKRVVQDNNDSPVKSLAKEPIIWNAFLLAFCKRQQFARASAVITDMTDNSPQPNIYSWNIFMQSFFKTGQIRAAERVFEIMRNRHIEPDQYSYGILLRGYAKAQMLEQIEQKIEHLDAENQLDPDLLQALIRVHDRKKLLVALENNRLEQVRRAREKSIREAEEFERRWQPRLASVSSPQPPTASELFNGPRQFRADHGRSESIASQPNIRTSGRDTD